MLTARLVRMPDRHFWRLIDHLGGQARDVAPLVDALAAQRPATVLRFADALARHLRALDRHDLFIQPVHEPDAPVDDVAMTDDGFLYARCAVIAAGQARYDQVRADPTRWAGTWDTDGEALLYAAEQAWTRRTGRDYDYQPPVDVETATNPRGGWGPQSHSFQADPDPVAIDFSAADPDGDEELGYVAGSPPPGRTFYATATSDAMDRSAPAVQAQASALIRDHGGWPAPTLYVIVWLQPADHWDLAPTVQAGHLSGRPDGPLPFTGVPQYLAVTMTTNKDAEGLWSEDEKLTAMRGVIAHALLHVLTTTAPGHGATGVLRQWTSDADHLLAA